MSAFGIGVPELILIFVVALIVFGPGKLPEIGAGVGRAVREFRKATSEITSELTRELNLDDHGQQENKPDGNPDSKGEGEHNKTT